MTRPVRHIGDELFGLSRRATKLLVHDPAQKPDQVDVTPFVMTSDIVGFTVLSLMENNINRLRMIDNPEPVTNILSLAINRKGFAVDDIIDKKRDELFRKLE